MTAPAYTVSSADVVAERETALAVWHGSLGDGRRMPAKYDWFYLGNPDGMPMLALLHHRDGGPPVGAVAAGQRRMQWRGAPIRAGLMVDFAVDAGHRSLGPALVLQRQAIRLALEQAEVLYAFPNERAAPVYQRAGYRHAGDAVRHARVVHYGRYLARHLPRALAAVAGAALSLVDGPHLRWSARGLYATWSDRAIDEMDALWQGSARGDGLLTVRDTAYLRWRFDRNPLVRTRYLLLRDRAGRLRAWFACRREEDAGILTVQDFWSDDAIAGLSQPRAAALLRAAREADATVVWVELAGMLPRAGWRAAGFRERSRRPVFMHATAIDGDALAARFHLTGGDEDE
ncbi:hypothetical protein [Luteimonas aestuarii]|uniref:hypothetical protein n=1 Tax=Luteimonas aestuarii TaxID=453837 RepID=UPI001404ABBB|nr:hypothetical protein [Luteimonas aestuarii]